MKICEMMDILAPFAAKTRPVLTGYCRDGSLPAVRDGNRWFPDGGFVNRAVLWRRKQMTLEDILSDSGIRELTENEQWKCIRQIKLASEKYFLEENCYSILFTGHFIASANVDEVRTIVSREISHYSEKLRLVPIKEAARALGVSVYQAKQSDSLPAVRLRDGLYCKQEDIDALNASKEQYIGVFTLATELLSGMHSLFDPGNYTDRMMLHKYIRESDLRDTALPASAMPFPVEDRKNTVFFPVSQRKVVEKYLYRFFAQYGMVNERIRTLEADPYWTSHPVTKDLIDSFETGKVDNGMAALMETIIHALGPEITECTDEDIEALLAYASRARLKVYRRYVVMFVNYAKKKVPCRYGISLKCDLERKSHAVDTSPYPFPQYLAFASLVFSAPMIEENGLVSKAFEDVKYALLWLFSIWQYVSAWRVKDFFSLPILDVPWAKEELKERILARGFDGDAVKLSMLLENEVNGKRRPPSKTAGRQETSDEKAALLVVFPETLRSVIGIAYAICVAMTEHCPFPVVRFTNTDYEYMYGNMYTKIFGHHPFSNRRANKSFMGIVVQLVEQEVGNDNKVMGYSVASLARAHMVSPGMLSDITSRYLQYKLEGLTVDEILMQLWDTGICSFVPYMLLEAVYGDRFSTLPISSQTKVLLASNMSAYQAEAAARLIHKEYLHSKDVVQAILSSCQDQGKTAVRILQRLTGRQAASKQLGIQCPHSAMRAVCPFKANRKCMICPYKIPQTSSVHLYVREIESVVERKKKARTGGEKRKLAMLLKEYYFPAAYTVLLFCKKNYKIDVSEFRDRLVAAYEAGGLIYADQDKIE